MSNPAAGMIVIPRAADFLVIVVLSKQKCLTCVLKRVE